MSMFLTVAVTALALVSGSDAQLTADGSSAFSKVLAQFAPQVAAPWTYKAGGSGAGNAWVAAGNSLAFRDGPYAAGCNPPAVCPLPATLTEMPVALGAIALWINIPAVTGAEMGTACLSQADLCKIFDARTPGRGSSFTWDDILPQAAGTPVRVIVRSDSSGSTNVMRDQLIGMCGAGFTMVTPNTPGVLAGDGTSGVVNLARATQNSITYAACGQVESAPASPTDFTSFRQIAVSNRRNTCVLCEQCSPGRTSRCGVYTRFNIQPRICDWSGVYPNGDKDADNDAVIDLDNDQDGVGISDFAFVFLEFAMMPKVPRDMPTCRKAQDVVKHLLSTPVQTQLPNLGFFPIPLDTRQGACKCLSLKACAHVPKIAGRIVGSACV